MSSISKHSSGNTGTLHLTVDALCQGQITQPKTEYCPTVEAFSFSYVQALPRSQADVCQQNAFFLSRGSQRAQKGFGYLAMYVVVP